MSDFFFKECFSNTNSVNLTLNPLEFCCEIETIV